VGPRTGLHPVGKRKFHIPFVYIVT